MFCKGLSYMLTGILAEIRLQLRETVEHRHGIEIVDVKVHIHVIIIRRPWIQIRKRRYVAIHRWPRIRLPRSTVRKSRGPSLFQSLDDDVQTSFQQGASAHSRIQRAQVILHCCVCGSVGFFGVLEYRGCACIDAVAHEVGDVVQAEGDLEEKDQFFDAASGADANVIVVRYGPKRSMGQDDSREVQQTWL